MGCNLIDASSPLSAEEIEMVHQSGLALNSWTFNEVEEIKAAILELHPDGLTTEFPDRAVKLLQQQPGRNETITVLNSRSPKKDFTRRSRLPENHDFLGALEELLLMTRRK
jgi:hypothetical protein